MKLSKKISAFLLAMLCVFSIGFSAFAIPIATSPNGLKKGEYYLNFSRYTNDSALAAGLASGTWELYADAMQISAFGLSEPYASYYRNSAPGRLIAFSLDQVGIQWIPVAESKAKAKAGGWFFDKEAAISALVAFYADDYDASSTAQQDRISECRELVEDFLANYTIAVNPGDQLLRYQVTAIQAETDSDYRIMRLPVYHAMNPESTAEAGHMVALEAAVQQLEAPKPKTGIAKIVEEMKVFFKKLAQLFLNMFRFGR